MEEANQFQIEARTLGKSRPDGHVLFRDSHGGIWEVHEVLVAPSSPWARGDRCLLFRSPGTIRRVWNYPAEWRELAPPDLEALSWQT